MDGLFVMSILFNNFFVLFIHAYILGVENSLRRGLCRPGKGVVKAVETIA